MSTSPTASWLAWRAKFAKKAASGAASRERQHLQCEIILAQSKGKPLPLPSKQKTEDMIATTHIWRLQIPRLENK